MTVSEGINKLGVLAVDSITSEFKEMCGKVVRDAPSYRVVYFSKKSTRLMVCLGNCGRTGYTGPTGRTGPRHDPPDPSAYSTHTALPRLAS